VRAASDEEEEPEVPTSDGDDPELPTDEPMETSTPVVKVMRTKRAAMRRWLQAPKRARFTDAGTRWEGNRSMGGRNLMDACK
jgi:hypothetical protein